MDRSDLQVRRLQSIQTLLERASGSSLTETAKRFNLDPAPLLVKDKAGWRTRTREQIEDIYLGTLAPLVLAVYESHLRAGNLDAARDVAQGIGLFRKPGQTVTVKPAESPNDIESYRLDRQKRRYEAPDRSYEIDDNEPRM